MAVQTSPDRVLAEHPEVAPVFEALIEYSEGREISSRCPKCDPLDPRVHTSQTGLEAQLDLAKQMDAWMNISYRAYNEAGNLRSALDTATRKLPGESQIVALAKELDEIQNGTNAVPGFGFVNRDLARFVTMIQSGDMRPSKSVVENATVACSALKNDLGRWRQINQNRSPNLNVALKQNKIESLPLVSVPDDPRCPNQ